MEFSVDQIAALVDGKVQGDGSRKIKKVEKIQEADITCISFLANPKYENYLYSSNAGAVIVSKDFKPKKDVTPALIFVDDAYSAFTQLLEEYEKILKQQLTGVEEPAFLGANCEIGEHIYRGAFSYIGNGSTIGNNCKVFPHVYIGEKVTVGEGTIIYPGVKIYGNTKIGKNCTLHAGAVIGSDGFGFAPQKDGSYKAIPQLGNVIIEDNVSIGANTVIDCATLGSTLIKDGAKLDNLIQIAHNVTIGKNTAIAAQSGVSGSAEIGDNCILAGQVGVVGHLKVANRTTLAAQTGISKSITKEGEVIIGSPGFDRSKYLKSYAAFRNLPELLERVKQLEEKTLNLPADS